MQRRRPLMAAPIRNLVRLRPRRSNATLRGTLVGITRGDAPTVEILSGIAR